MIGKNMNEAGPNEELLAKLQALNPKWGLTYKDYLGGTTPQFDSGGPEFLNWEGGIGDSDTMRPVLNMPYTSPETPDLYDPRQLGYSALDANMLNERGVKGLPSWMMKDRIYSPAVHLGGDDPLQAYADAMQDPSGADRGKARNTLLDMGWSGGKFSGSEGVSGDLKTRSFAPEGAEPTWGDPEQLQYAKDYLRRKWTPDDKGLANPERIANAATGIMSIAAPAYGVMSAAPAAGAAAGAGLAGSEAGGAALPGLTAAEIAAEFPAMAGTSLAAPELAATPGFFGSGIGAAGTANAPLGGLFGTGVGLEGAAMSNAPVTGGKDPGDFIKRRAGSAFKQVGKKLISDLMPEPQMESSGGQTAAGSGEAPMSTPTIESGYYNRFTGERLSPEEFFRMHGRAQSVR